MDTAAESLAVQTQQHDEEKRDLLRRYAAMEKKIEVAKTDMLFMKSSRTHEEQVYAEQARALRERHTEEQKVVVGRLDVVRESFDVVKEAFVALKVGTA